MKYFPLVIFLLCSSSIFAQTDSALLREVLLISTKTAEKTTFEANDLPIILPPKIEKEAFISIQEGLENISSVDLQQRGPIDIQSDLSIRGGTFNQSLVLIDGVPYSDPQTGHHNMNLPFALNDIGMIEVSTGNSRLLGPQAFSGAINFSIAMDTGFYHQFQFFGGRFGLGGFYAKNGFRIDKHQLQISINGSRSDGYTSNTDFEQAGAVLNWRTPIKGGEIKLFAATFGKAFGAQNFYSTNYPSQFENTRGWMGHVTLLKRTESVVHRSFISTKYHRDRFELFRETGGYFQWIDGALIMENDTAPEWYSGPNYHRSKVLTGEYSAEINWNNRHQTVVAIQMREEGIMSNVLGDSISVPVTTSDGGVYDKSRNRTNGSATINHNFERGKWKASAGILVNINSDYASEWNPGLNVGYFIRENWKLVYTVNRSFRIPTFTELYYNVGGAVGSEDLLPERAWVQNLGTVYRHKQLELYAALHHRFTLNGIDWLDQGNRIAASNISTIDFFGVDINATLNWKNRWIDQLKMGYSFLQGDHDRENQSVYALRYLRHNLILNGVHSMGNSWRLIWTGRIQERYTSSDNEPQSPFFTLALSMQYKTSDQWTAQLLIQNATNTSYADRFGIRQPGIWPMIRIGKEF